MVKNVYSGYLTITFAATHLWFFQVWIFRVFVPWGCWVLKGFEITFILIIYFQYFYSIKDISVGAICMCNGHADQCLESQRGSAVEFVCRCKHNTCGSRCEKCCPSFVQKKWRPGLPTMSNECEGWYILSFLYSFFIPHIQLFQKRLNGQTIVGLEWELMFPTFISYIILIFLICSTMHSL